METITQRRAIAPPFGDSRPPRLGLRASFCDLLLRIANVVLTWQERARQRAALASMEDHILKDIGLTRADAMRESGRPFWPA